MPEGPSIVILKEELSQFRGKKIIAVTGNAKIDLQRLLNKKVVDFKSWGKHFLICFDNFFLRIHMLMWGTYRINERKEAAPRLSITFKNGEVNFYTCSIRLIEQDVNKVYDWETDIMSDKWNPGKAEKALKKLNEVQVCDALLDQEIFSGVGNIIKNEVLYRVKIHPESYVESLPSKKLKELVKEARNYSMDFYTWKKAFELRKHWLIYRQKMCNRCNLIFHKDHLGERERLTFFCSNCQLLYKNGKPVKPRLLLRKKKLQTI